MNRRSIWPPVYVAGLLLVVGVLAFSGPHSDVEARGRVTFSAAADTIPDLVGLWVGTWEDTIYHVSGAMSFSISQEGSDLSASGSIDLSAIGLGLEPGAAEGTITATFDGNTLNFTFQAATVGNGMGTITGGSGVGTGTVTAPLNFGDFTFEGTVTEGEITGSFDFLSPTGGMGIASLTEQTATEPATWGNIKALYRGGSH